MADAERKVVRTVRLHWPDVDRMLRYSPEMPYREHPAFASQPSDAARLWRYTDIAKLVVMLQDSALWLCQLGQLEDAFEGAITPEAMREYYGDIEPLDRRLHFVSQMIGAGRRYSYVSCWHENEYESAAMWKIYGETGAVAVETTFGQLKRSLIRSERDLYIGRIEYLDYETGFFELGNMFSPVLRKRRSFDFEREVRIVSSHMVDPGPPGLNVQVDLKELVTAIWIAPQAQPFYEQAVHHVLERFELLVSVHYSSLADPPLV